jgi:hypothetical protein
MEPLQAHSAAKPEGLPIPEADHWIRFLPIYPELTGSELPVIQMTAKPVELNWGQRLAELLGLLLQSDLVWALPLVPSSVWAWVLVVELEWALVLVLELMLLLELA